MSIPKTIHLIWLGGKRPSKFDPLLDSIKTINSDYEVIEWNDNNINFKPINYKILSKCHNYGARSDILRAEILNKYGGIYSDYDSLQIKKFDDLLDYDFFAGTHLSTPNEIWPGIIGASVNNEIIQSYIYTVQNTINRTIHKTDIDTVMSCTGPWMFSKVFWEKTWSSKTNILVGEYFYPFPTDQRLLIRNITPPEIAYARSFATEKTYCVHFHTCSWQ